MYLKKYLMTVAALFCMLPLSAINPQNSKMKELSVKKVSVANVPVESVPALLDKEKVAFQPVNTVNWADYPYCPDVEFRIAHTSDAILLHFKVKEGSVAAVAGHDNGPGVGRRLCGVLLRACRRRSVLQHGVQLHRNFAHRRRAVATVVGMPRKKCSTRCSAGLLWVANRSRKE